MRRDFWVFELAVAPRQRLDDVLRLTSALPFGGTDCALPMLWALKERVANLSVERTTVAILPWLVPLLVLVLVHSLIGQGVHIPLGRWPSRP